MKRICISCASSILDRDEETACTFHKIRTVNKNNSCDKFRQKKLIIKKEKNTMKVRITNGLFKGSEGVIQKLEDINLVAIEAEKSIVVVPVDREFLEVISGPIEKEESPRKRDKFFMVWRSQGSSPNKKHETYEAAQEEAKRLVKNNPNVTFYVLEALDEIKAEVEIKEKKLG